MSGAGDVLAGALLPVVMHRLNNATQLLSNVQTLMALGEGDAFLAARADDLGETSATVEELGYLLAVLASASGADLLLERREERGLELMVDAVRGALRREGSELPEPEGPLPRLAPDAGRGWELPWAVGAALLVTGRAAEGQLAWSLAPAEGEVWRLELAGPAGRALAELEGLLHERLPGSELTMGEEHARLRLPAGWVRAQEEAPAR